MTVLLVEQDVSQAVRVASSIQCLWRGAPRWRAVPRSSRRSRSRPRTSDCRASEDRRELGQRRDPGHPPRWAAGAVRVRPVVAVRNDAGHQPGARRPGDRRRVPRRGVRSRAAPVGAAVGDLRRADLRRARVRRPADADPDRSGPRAVHGVAGHVRPVGHHRERPAGGVLRRQPLDQHRLAHLRLHSGHRSDLHRVPLARHLRARGGRSAWAAVLPVLFAHRAHDPRRRRRPGGRPAVRSGLQARLRRRGRRRVRHGGAGGHRLRDVLVVQRLERRELAPLRVRGRGHRRPRLAVGNAARRHHPGGLADGRAASTTRACRSSRGTSCSSRCSLSARRGSRGGG